MKAMYVIRREYTENVRRKSFIVTTILVPLFMAALIVLPVTFALLQPEHQNRVAVVDQTGKIGPEFVAALTDSLKKGGRKYLCTVVSATGENFEAAKQAQIDGLRSRDTDIVVAIPQDVMTGGKAAYITREQRNYNILDRFEDVLNNAVLKERLATEGIDYERVKTLTSRVKLEMNQMNKEGGLEQRNFLAEYGVVFVFVMILYSALISWGMTIAKSIVEEKGSRIIEVLLSTLSARDLMIGKLVGVGLAGLTQLAIWGVVGFLLAGSALPMLVAQMGTVHVSPLVFVYFPVFFVLGFLLFASLFMVVGAVSSTEQDAQQMQAIVTLPMIIPLMSLMLFIQSPNSGLAVAMSLIPVFTPLLMLARIILLTPPMWQIALGIGLMLVAIFFSVTVAARIFRVGILMYGKRPSLREMMHWYRMAG
ncbi:MAG TPA: ABC transporter permease [Candidatus Krumholzibacteria bacterium]|nr:ABC transporter permease [Candidatus Krumholzibacteria bacterium]